MKQPTLRTKRVYDPPSAKDGLRVLVDRLWPRGLTKAEAHVDLWLKGLAPSNELRRKFHAGTLDWSEFVTAYKRELAQADKQAAGPLAESKSRTITFLYASKDDEQNNAVVLAKWLETKLRPKKPKA